ncbi:rCG23297 [Rattus norvegicus]|uniref:Uncharacterized protein n=2 Tax=Rattus norvegicus TaxID=10116 RepID=A0A0G2K4N0_RAT|nr:rCG23297 [Rattus norvegicus]
MITQTTIRRSLLLLAGRTAGQRLRRQLPSSARQGDHSHPGRLHPGRWMPGTRLCLPRCHGPGLHEAGSIVWPESGTAVPVARRDHKDVGIIAVATILPVKMPSIICAMYRGTSNKGS